MTHTTKKQEIRESVLLRIRQIEPQIPTIKARIKGMVESGEKESAQFWSEYLDQQRKILTTYYDCYRRNC